MLYTFGFYGLMPTVPMYIRWLGFEPLVGAVALSFTVSAVVMRFISPALLQSFGKKRILVIGVALSAIVTIPCAFTRSIQLVFVFRILQGFGFGLVSTCAATLAADLLPDSRRGEGMGYFAMGTTVMVAGSQSIGQLVEARFGVPAVFIAATAGEVLSLATLFFFNPPRAILFPANAKKLSVAKSFFVPALLLQCILLIFFGFARSSEQTFLRLLAADRGISTVSYFAFQTLVSFFAKYTAGILYDRKGYIWCVLPGAVSLIIALVIMSVARTLPVLLIAGFFSGTGMGCLLPGMQTWTITGVKPEERSVASAAYYNYYDIGQSVGAPILAGLAAATATGEIRNYALSFRAAAGVMVVFIAVLFIGRFRKRVDTTI
jgi:MFS family permease